MRVEYIVVLIAVIVIVDVAVLVTLLRKHRARTAPADPTTTSATELGATDLPKKSAAPVLAKAFLAVGLSLAAAAGVFAAIVTQTNSSDRHADGTVVELVPSGGGSSPRYRARVEFATSTGTHVRFLSSISSNPPPPSSASTSTSGTTPTTRTTPPSTAIGRCGSCRPCSPSSAPRSCWWAPDSGS